MEPAERSQGQVIENFSEVLTELIECAIHSIHKAKQLPEAWEVFLSEVALPLVSEQGDSLFYPNIKRRYPPDTKGLTKDEHKDDHRRQEHNRKIKFEWNIKIKKVAVAIAIMSFQDGGVRYAGHHYESFLESDCIKKNGNRERTANKHKTKR